jgi:hypothetical protein
LTGKGRTSEVGTVENHRGSSIWSLTLLEE